MEDNDVDESRIFNLDEIVVTPDKEVTGVSFLRRLFPKRRLRDIVMNKFGHKDQCSIRDALLSDHRMINLVEEGKRLNYTM